MASGALLPSLTSAAPRVRWIAANTIMIDIIRLHLARHGNPVLAAHAGPLTAACRRPCLLLPSRGITREICVCVCVCVCVRVYMCMCVCVGEIGNGKKERL